MESDKKTFEECYPIIDSVVKKYKNRWQLKAINWMDFHDVEQLIKIHIHKKWHLWNQDMPLEPWVATIAGNRIKNLIRNHYGNYASPCVRCPYNMGDDLCGWTKSGKQNTTCPQYKKWSEFKKDGYGIKIPLPLENHQTEADQQQCSHIDFEEPIVKLNELMRRNLSEIHYQAYIKLFFENQSDEEVAKFMGYKSNEKNRTAGYKQIKNIKKMLQEKARQIINEHDIIIN